MYILYADGLQELQERSGLFEQHMEPLLKKLDAVNTAGAVPSYLPEIQKYLQVCRWPFRKLEYSLVLDALLARLGPGDTYLDAGSGVTPLAHILAARGVRASACDGNAFLIEHLREFNPASIYGSDVEYQAQNLTRMTYADATFDAISCVSVLEHIAAPHDQTAIGELLRILKPGGLLVITVDFSPHADVMRSNRLQYFIERGVQLARRGELGEIGRGLQRKLTARNVVQAGMARHARSANQCFQFGHLEHDIRPTLVGEEVVSNLPFSTDLHAITPAQARQFWDLQPGLFNDQGQRSVLPVGVILRK